MPAPNFPPDTLFSRIGSLDHEPALAQALGNMIVAWSDAERAMQTILTLVTEMPKKMTVASYFAIPTFESRVKYLLALIDAWDDHRKDTVKYEIEKLRSLTAARNTWVHGAYAKLQFQPDVTAIFDFRSKTTHRARPVKTNDINVHCEAVRNRTDRLYELAGYPPTPR